MLRKKLFQVASLGCFLGILLSPGVSQGRFTLPEPERTEKTFSVTPAVSQNNRFGSYAIPQNPWLAENNYGSAHMDSWCSESVYLSGPTGQTLKLTIQRNPYGFIPTMAINQANQMIGSSYNVIDNSYYLVVYDTETLELLSATKTGTRKAGSFSGGYFYLDNEDNTLFFQENVIYSYPTKNLPKRSEPYALEPNWASTNIVELATSDDSAENRLPYGIQTARTPSGVSSRGTMTPPTIRKVPSPPRPIWRW